MSEENQKTALPRKKPRNTVELEVYGDYALFSDPVTRVGGEKCSYQVPTYEAIVGILNSVYWKPSFCWIPDQLRVMNKIQFTTKGVRTLGYSNGESDLSYYTYLKNVRYQISAHFEWNMSREDLAADRNENKHHEIAKRMIARGGRRDVFLGTRECQAFVEPCVFGEGQSYYDAVLSDGMQLGYMYHGFTYPDTATDAEEKGKLTVRFWSPTMEKNGIIRFTRPDTIPKEDRRIVRDYSFKQFEPDKNFSGASEFDADASGGEGCV